MDRERPHLTVLIVDHDEVSLAFLANMLMAQQYRVQTAKNAHDALVTLRSNEGLFDIIITEFHVLGMHGFDFQKHIRDQFQIPIIMMSKDNRQHIISKTLENGAAHFIVKPICAEDFKDIWKYVDEAKKHKLFIENLFIESEEQEITSEQPKTKEIIYCKRKSIDEGEGECQVIKKPKLVWTPELHNLFVDAIKQIGLGKVVPLKILEIMNVPGLTRENVASHLQKFRLFMRDVAKKGMIGGISHRASKSMFASSLPPSVIREIQEMRTRKLCAPSSFSSYWNLESLRNSSILPHNVTCNARNNNPFGIQINSGSQMVGNGTMNRGGFNSIGIRVDTTNRNNFGLNVGGQNANMNNFGLNVGGQIANMNFGSLAYENFGLVQGGFGSVSYGNGGNVSDSQSELVNQENVSGNNGGTLTNVDEFNQMEFNNFDFSMVDDTDLLNEIGEKITML